MTAYLMTRGTPRRLDYRFLGASPPQRWWGALGDCIVLERAEVVVRGGDSGTGVLLSGIPSARRDVVGTVIRFTLVVDDPDPALLARLVAHGLDDEARVALGAALDAELPADWVDTTLDGESAPGDDIGTRLARVLATAVDDLPVHDPGDRVAASSWVWAAQDRRAVAAFVDRAAQLGAGAPGWAFTTAALRSVEGVRRAAAMLDEPVAVLLGEGGPAEAVDVGKVPAGRPAGRRPVRVILVLVVLLAVATLLGLATLAILI